MRSVGDISCVCGTVVSAKKNRERWNDTVAVSAPVRELKAAMSRLVRVGGVVIRESLCCADVFEEVSKTFVVSEQVG